MSENDFDVVMDELTNKAVGRLLKADVFDVSAFSVLRDHLWQKAERLQHETCISK